MKKLCKYIISGALLLTTSFSTTSCSDFLEENAVTQITLDDIDSFDMLEILLWGAFQSAQLCYEGQCVIMGNVGTDNHHYLGTAVAQTVVDSYSMTATAAAPATFWTRHFAVVADANTVMDKGLELYEAGIILEDEYKEIYYQALFLRGFAHLRLLQTYGELPLIDYRIVNISDDVPNIPRSSICETVQFIERDFLEIINEGSNHLPYLNATGSSTSRDGTPSIWAAKALLARLYLYVGSSIHRETVGTPEGAKQLVFGANAGNPLTFENSEEQPEYIMDILNDLMGEEPAEGNKPIISYEDIEGGKTGIIPGYQSDNFVDYENLYTNETKTRDHMDFYKLAYDQLKLFPDNFSLETYWFTPFLIGKKNVSSESIWEIQFASDTDGGGSDWSKNFGQGSNSTSVWRYNGSAGNTVVSPTMTYFKNFKWGDTRRSEFACNLFVNSTSKTVDLFSTATTGWGGTEISIINPEFGTTAAAAVMESDWDYHNLSMYGIASTSYFTANYMGTRKYSWGASSSYTSSASWYTETNTYTYDECPNNVVVIRYTDVLLMLAELEALINGGADPSKPQEPLTGSGATNATAYLNEILLRTVPTAAASTQASIEIDGDYISTNNSAQYTYLSSLVSAKSTRKTSMEGTLATYNDYTLDIVGSSAIDKLAYYGAYVSDALRYQDVSDRIQEFVDAYNNSGNVGNGTLDDYLTENMINEYNALTLTYEDIIDERGKELDSEFLRWYDLQRLGWLEYKVSRRITCLGTRDVVKLTVPKHYLYPISSANINLANNPDFYQNPGY